jgi:IS1 family transposase/lambda repressor-like predicted transcriptional regulator
MNKLDTARRAQIISALVEGCSIRSTSRMTGASKNTIIKLLEDVGAACANYQDAKLRNLDCRLIQCDEIWSFCYAKQKNVAPEHEGVLGYGDVWTWTAVEQVTKLVPCWHVGRRDAQAAEQFIKDLASRLKNRVQITTDGHRSYLEAIEGAFGCEVDYAMLIKLYGKEQDEIRYSPSKCIGSYNEVITGDPFPPAISTSHVERQNLTMRMSMRRFTRLTNGFSKKLENHMHAVSLHYMHYNFARVHQTLRCSPAMEAGVTGTLWSVKNIVELADNPKYARKDED